MTAQPQNHPLPGNMPLPPAATPRLPPPPPMAYGPIRSGAQPLVAVEPTTRRASGLTRQARTALAISLLVAVAGVSFALGRASVESTSSSRSAMPFAAAAAPAGTGTAADDAVALAAGADTATADDSSAAATTAGGSADGSTVSAVSLSDGTGTATDLAAGASTLDGTPDRLGGMDGPPGGGFGRGGVQGTVTEVSDTALVVTLDDGSTQTVAVDDTTEWLEQLSITAADVAAGDTVSVQLPMGGFGSDDDTAAAVATQVTVTTSAP